MFIMSGTHPLAAAARAWLVAIHQCVRPAAYAWPRLCAHVPGRLGEAVVGFSPIHVPPGDPAAYMLGPSASPEEVEHLRGVLGLNLPLYQQFVIWLGRAVRGDLGQSIFMGIPVSV